MPTFLFDEIVFGPVKSRRLGTSLGINLLPTNGKLCSFDCLYCECGLNEGQRGGRLPSRQEVKEALAFKFNQMMTEGIKPDVITFAGNGEPTLHPAFSDIVDDVMALRDNWFPAAQVCVLSNATQLHKPAVLAALRRVNQSILKLDSAMDTTVRIMDRPVSTTFTVQGLANQLKTFGDNLIIQTMFIRGVYNGLSFDNTTDQEVASWIDLLNYIKPSSVMIYTIDRDTPVHELEKVPLKTLKSIAALAKKRTGLTISISG
jgi:wyosine [tRNA(Phe)-imidazoG37] synthetase (radical SAM superfamily)